MGKRTKTSFKKGQTGNPNGRPPVPPDLKKARAMRRTEFEDILNKYVHMSGADIILATRDQSLPIIEGIVAKILGKAFNEGDPRRTEFILDRLIGKPAVQPIDIPPLAAAQQKKTFTQFCTDAGYPPPFPKQIEMMDFGLTRIEPRLLLGARGYGKTDYVTILGVAYKIYLRGVDYSCLIITKSKTRNVAIIEEIANALKRNGVQLEKENASCIRVLGRLGKDHSVEVLTIKSSFRGRHPDELIFDDPVTEEDVSEAMRLLVERKYNEAYKLCPNILIIGQPAHQHDLYAKLRSLLVKMEVPHGIIPELDHDLKAMKLAGVDERSISMSYHLQIPKDGSAPFDSINFIDQFPSGDTAVAFIDPSHEGVDYTALSIFKQHFERLVVRGHVWKKSWNHCLDEMVPHLKATGVKRLAFETNALGDQPIIMLRQILEPLGIGVVGRRSNNNKHSRIMAAGAFAHMIDLSKESDRVYTDQVRQYEYKSKHDDAPDSLATGMEWIGLIRGKV